MSDNIIYESLPQDVPSIRLLEMSPAEGIDDRLSCRLVTVPLDTDKAYTALSYRWDEKIPPEEISVNDIDMTVGGNLASALRHIRAEIARSSSPLSPLVWADGVCINQSDVEERSSQVQLMGAVYSNASTVVSWLGNVGNRYTYAIDLIRRMQIAFPDLLKDPYWMVGHPLLDKDNEIRKYERGWSAFGKFLRAQYWCRIWVLQEVVLARNLWVMVDQQILDYESMRACAEVVTYFATSLKFGEKLFPEGHISHMEDRELLKSNGFNIILGFRKLFKSSGQMSDVDKIEAVFTTLTYQATDPRDKIFALQGLLGNFIAPDYTKSTLEVYLEFASKCIAVVGGLSLLRFAGSFFPQSWELRPKLPSWVPNWHVMAIYGWEAFPALDATQHSDRNMTVSSSSGPRVLNEHQLRVSVCICDTVTDAKDILEKNAKKFKDLYQRFVDKRLTIESRTKVVYLEAILQALWSGNEIKRREYCGDQDDLFMERWLVTTVCIIDVMSAADASESSLRSSLKDLEVCYERALTSRLVELSFGIAASDEASLYRALQDQGFLTRMFRKALISPAFLQDLHLFCTRDGYIGSSRRSIQVGDVIGVIPGCPCPVLLRKEGDGYLHIGTCYVVGLMNGEAALRVEEGSLAMEEIDLI